jgi:serine protease AprX
MSTQFGLKRALKVAGTLVAGVLVCAGVLGSGLQAQAGAPSNILSGPELAGKIDASVTRDLAQDGSASVIILMKDQANVTPAYSMKDQNARGWYVYNTLRQQAEKSQAQIKDMLIREGVEFKSYWAANMISAEANAGLVDRLAARDDVKVIESNAPQKWIDPLSPESPLDPSVVEWGVQNVNAPQVWALGYTGTGMVVGNQDTGMRWTHNAIKPKYRGWDGANANHNYNWWDAIHSGGGTCGPNSQQPCDDHSHGTHTTGTTVGDDGAGNQIGVAPGAKWIGCRNMNVGVGTPATYTECFQFFIAPTDLAGQNANPALRPHVMNNSWGCPPSEGCSANSLLQIVENTQAAGIFVVVSAGNAGSACSTVNDPPAIYAASYSVGSITSANALSSFSSRGPVTVDGSNRLKPDISAPGSGVRSATNTSDTAYASFSGTSMAGPHVVGAVALLWDARPALERAITETKTLLNMTANPNVTASGTCGGTGQGDIPNNLFGYGRVDALAAVQSQGGTATPGSATNTPTVVVPSPTVGTPQATPTGCVPNPGGWTGGPNLPTNLVRAWGQYFPANGRFYSLGGRPSDTVGDSYRTPLEYNPATNTWTVKTAMFPDAQTSNVVGGVLNVSGTPVILLVGGSAGGGTGGTTEVRMYNPVADSMTVVATDPWTPGTTHVPGGAAVVNNKLYVLGGFDIPGGVADNRIWEYDPTRTAGTRWVLKTGTLPTPLAYIPAVAIGGMIYTGGGSLIIGGTLEDSDLAYKYDPAADTVTTLPTLPAVTAETRAVAMNGRVWVLGGGRTDPNPSNTVYIYDPVANSWSTGSPFVTPRRNFPADSDGTGRIWLAGGYAPTTPTNNMEIFNAPVVCVTVTPAATNTVGSTATSPAATNTPGGGTPTSTPTACTLEFTDVPSTNTFYPFVRCLACQGIINGYPCGGDFEPCDPDNNPYFRPNNYVTRGQLSKIVSQSAGFSEVVPPTQQSFEDVPPASPFWEYVERLYGRSIIGGYQCGVDPNEPCVPPDNLPYFRPNNGATRGQLTKIVSEAAGFTDVIPGTQYTFADVQPNSTFWVYVERLLLNRPGVMSGYVCGSVPSEPCDAENRPYFRPNNPLTRGQTSKIVANTFFPGCNPPLGTTR